MYRLIDYYVLNIYIYIYIYMSMDLCTFIKYFCTTKSIICLTNFFQYHYYIDMMQYLH